MLGSDRMLWLVATPARLLGWVACLALFAMMMLTFVDVAGRYLFASPLPAAYELISLIMPFIVFCALPTVNLRQEHVTIDLLDQFIAPAAKQLQFRLVSMVSAIAMSVVSWRLAQRSWDHWRFDGATDELYLPLWPFSAVMAVLGAVSAVTLLAMSWSGRSEHSDGPVDGVGRT